MDQEIKKKEKNTSDQGETNHINTRRKLREPKKTMNCQSKRTHIVSNRIPRFTDFLSIVVKYPLLKDKNNFLHISDEKKKLQQDKKDND